MLPMSKDANAQLWMDRFVRFDDSETTVKQFCLDEGISLPSFYYWKRKVGGRRRARSEITQLGRDSGLAFEPVHVLPVIAAQQRTTIRLGAGVEIELGDDLPVVELVVQAAFQLNLQRQSPEAGGATC